MTANATSVVLEKVVKRYGEIEVIHGIDLTIDPGEFTVFVGPSGCGKSTLLRMIAGLEPITGGDLLIDGQRMNEVPAAKRGIAMVFQSYALYPHMSVYQNLAFGLETARVPKQEIQTRVQHAAEILRIEPLLKRKPRQLSGGQRQRVAIGRAIVREPRIFLFDEFLGQLKASGDGAVMIVDEAHSLPPATKEQVIEIATLASNKDRVLQFLLAGQPALGGAPMLPSLTDDRVTTRARLLPLERDEVEKYIVHRLAIGGCGVDHGLAAQLLDQVDLHLGQLDA